MEKVYLKMGLTEDDVLEIQHWLFPLIVDHSGEKISDIIIKINEKFIGNVRDYAIYILGYHIGGARVCQSMGVEYGVDPNNV